MATMPWIVTAILQPSMSFEIGLLPSGHLHCFPVVVDAGSPPESAAPVLFENFSRHPGEGLFTLAADRSARDLTPTLHYWRDFAGRYLSARCQLLGEEVPPRGELPLTDPHSDPAPPVTPLSPADAGQWLQSAPLMRGAEYLSIEVLQAIWSMLDDWVREQIRVHGSLAALLNEKAPQWHPVGRVCFHLAENKRDPDYPFAFMATYAPEQQAQGRIRYQPLRRALQEYADARDKQTLIRLLSPVHRAAEASPMVGELVESGDIYQPLAWTPEEAYRFLREVPLYEESGLVVRLPDWWRKHSRPQVGVRIGNTKQKRFGQNALLDFQVRVAIGDEPLSEEELEELLTAEAGLAFIKGRWVEVDRERLSEALAHWKRVEAEAMQGGLSFAEGMRLLAGAPADLEPADTGEGNRSHPSEFSQRNSSESVALTHVSWLN